MKKFEMPEIMVINLELEDIMLTSGDPFTKGGGLQSAGSTVFKDVWDKIINS